MSISEQQIQSDLVSAGLIRAVALASLMLILVICHIYGEKIQLGLDESLRVKIRTALYIVAIIMLPLIKFARHVLLRLQKETKPPKSRYLLTISVCMMIAESIALFGFAMYILGDSYNTLYIFTMISALAMFLHRPDKLEYKALFAKVEH
ncbi:MAG: hypothetical protein GQ582_10865 [Methyloprofundus sp.]|nr:hypothetical protein [Methyloprofundus sp.]